MAITTTDRRVQYTQAGSTTEWPVDFYFQEESDLVVIKTVDGEDTVLTLDSDYTVSGADNNDGGTVTIDPAIEVDAVLTIYRDLTMTQEVNLRNQGGWYPEVHERVFDKLTMLIQQVKESVDRKVGLDITDTRSPDDYLQAVEEARDEAEAAQSSAKAARDDAKEWATTTGGEVDSTGEFSAKEYAQGTTATGGTSKQWAQASEDTDITGANDYSALHWAAKASLARDEAYTWAEAAEDTEITDAAGNSGYSAFHWTVKAEDEKNGAQSARNKAEDWAEADEDVEVETGQYSAKHWSAKAHEAENGAEAARDEAETAAAINAAVAPAHYARDIAWAVEGSATASERLTLLTPSYLTVNINRSGYLLSAQQVIDITLADSWDDTTSTDWTTASNRAGKDFYIYACVPNSGDAPDFILSANSTVPDSMPSGETPTSDNTRKTGGFHCLCADVGTISDHDLSDYVAGDILPQSVWDLNHRPESEPEGMVYDPGTGKWVDIYLVSVQSGELASVYDATTADGESAEKFHWYKFNQWLRRIKKRFPFQGEFVSFSLGSNQGTNIEGGSDPGTTGGHDDTDGRRMISNIGCEDCCGALWQWGIEAAATGGGSSWSDAYDSNDSDVAGQHYEVPNRPRFGGDWSGGSKCGSRGSGWNASPLHLHATIGARGVAEPLKRGQ